MKPNIPSRRTVIVWSLVLFACTWLLYANSLSNEFAIDDGELVVGNTFLHAETPVWKIFSTTYRAGAGYVGDGLYRPLVILSVMCNGDPANPVPFHFVNVTLNALNTTLFFLLLLVVSRNIVLSGCAALIFGLHPIHTEAVANIAGRPELMCVFFLLIAWIILEKYREKAWGLGVAMLFFFAALLSKETAAIFPFLVIANDFAHKRPVLTRTGVFRYASLAGVIIIYMVIRENVFGDYPGSLFGENPGVSPAKVDNPLAGLPYGDRIASAFDIFSRYIGQMLFPLHLSSDYSYNVIPAVSFPHPGVLLGVALMAGLIGTAIVAYRRGNALVPLAVALFFFPALLVSNILFPIGTIRGDRLMYLPSAGFALGLALPRRAGSEEKEFLGDRGARGGHALLFRADRNAEP